MPSEWCQSPDIFIHILRMDELYPFPSFHLLRESHSGVISPLLIEIIHGAVRPGREYFLGHRFGHETQALATLLYCFLRVPARCDIPRTPDAAYIPLSMYWILENRSNTLPSASSSRS